MSEITSWKKREGFVRESVWLSEGIKLYRERLEENPDDLKLKTELARLLIRSGTDEKIKYVNLMDAKVLFEEVLQLFPGHAEALYRLGHISYENGHYEKSIEYFNQALSKSLSEIRAFRSTFSIAKAYHYLGENEKALSFLQRTIELDQERNFTNEIKEVEALLSEEGRYERVVRYSDGTIFVTLDQVESIKAETAVDEEAEIDVSHFQPIFTGPEDFAKLERKEADILCYLIERDNRYVSKEELLNVWDEDEQPAMDTIKSYISKIKRKVGGCFPEGKRQIISTKRMVGYRWVSEIPTKIIKIL